MTNAKINLVDIVTKAPLLLKDITMEVVIFKY